jgi:hypothetical protein
MENLGRRSAQVKHNWSFMKRKLQISGAAMGPENE